MRNKIYTIVEGRGEANRPYRTDAPAVTILINRLLRHVGCRSLYCAEKVPPFRLNYSDFFHEQKFENAIRIHTKYSDCAGLLILLDMDDGCPREKAKNLVDRISGLGILPFSVAIVCAKREYEAWFLASLESIHPGHPYFGDPEAKRDAKGWLRKEFGYKPTQDQPSYTRRLNITLAQERSRSFRRMLSAVEELVTSDSTGQLTVSPQIER